MIVYTVETIGGQITSYAANKENLPKFLEKPVKESFKKYGFCMWKTPEKIYSMIETLILLGCLYLSIRVTDYVEKQKQ